MSVSPSIPLLETPSDAGVADNASTGSEDEDIPEEEEEEEDPIDVVEPEPCKHELSNTFMLVNSYHMHLR